MTVAMVFVQSVARGGKAVLGAVSWRAMPLAVRVLLGVLVGFLVLVALHLTTPWLDVIEPVYEVMYNSVLVGSAVLCVARGVLGRSERLAWTVIGVSLGLWATGNLYWQFALSDLAEAPYPSVADAFWLGFLPVCYVGVLLLARTRMPQLDSRLWLDGVDRRPHHRRDQCGGRVRRGAARRRAATRRRWSRTWPIRSAT